MSARTQLVEVRWASMGVAPKACPPTTSCYGMRSYVANDTRVVLPCPSSRM